MLTPDKRKLKEGPLQVDNIWHTETMLNASFVTAISIGNSEKAIVRTTIFKVGEAIIADKVVSALAPALYMPLAIGAAQLTQTPNGAPIAIPSAEFAYLPLKDRTGKYRIRVRKAAPNKTPKVIPFLLVFTQFIVVNTIFFHIGIEGSTVSKASKLSGSSSWMDPSIIALLFRDGYRDSVQNRNARTTTRSPANIIRYGGTLSVANIVQTLHLTLKLTEPVSITKKGPGNFARALV